IVGMISTGPNAPAANFQFHPGFGLTARAIVAATRQAELGYPVWQCDMFDDVIESDAHLRSQLLARIVAVAGKPWVIQAGGDDPADVEAAQMLEEALRAVSNIADTFAHQLKSNWYGWSCSEIDWDYVDGLFVPVWFANVPHRRFVFDRNLQPLLTSA